MIPRRVEIYALSDDDGFLYIGKANDSRKRLLGHIRDTRRRNSPVHRWIRSLQQQGKTPTLQVVEVTDEDHWQERERWHIAKARAIGVSLLNLADGGNQPKPNPNQNRENALKLHERYKNDEAYRARRNAKIMIGTILRKGDGSNEFRAMLREYARNYPQYYGEYLNLPDVAA